MTASALADDCLKIAKQARAGSRQLALTPTIEKNSWLRALHQTLRERRDEILSSNALDLADAASSGLTAAQIDRLKLTPARLDSAAASLLEIAALPDPVGQVRECSTRPNGMRVSKVGVPLGVIFFIYESRPNVTLDAAALCVKSGNAVILRGGKEAQHSNRALHQIVTESLIASGLPRDAVQLVGTADRQAVGHLLRLPEWIDLVIPRGGTSLIERVVAEARMPVLKHYAGNCHIYVEKSSDFAMAEAIVLNAKCQRPGVCNAAESLLIDEAIAGSLLPHLAATLAEHGVEIRGCERTCALIPAARPATDADFATEFLDLILSIRVVDGIESAIEHIGRFGSGHTDAIVTNDLAAARRFTTAVDSAAVVVNASTRFNDGQELGLGAEIGISTDKYHARGPCGLLQLTSYKYILEGEGQIRV